MTTDLSGPVGFIADTHDHDALIHEYLGAFSTHDVSTIVHAGDIKQPETVELFADYDFHHVWGNGDINEGQSDAIESAIDAIGGSQDGWGERYRLGNGQKTVLVRHGLERNPSYSLPATDSSLDAVIHGHLHYQEDTTVGGGAGRVMNPGASGFILYQPDQARFYFEEYDADAVLERYTTETQPDPDVEAEVRR